MSLDTFIGSAKATAFGSWLINQHVRVVPERGIPVINRLRDSECSVSVLWFIVLQTRVLNCLIREVGMSPNLRGLASLLRHGFTSPTCVSPKQRAHFRWLVDPPACVIPMLQERFGISNSFESPTID